MKIEPPKTTGGGSGATDEEALKLLSMPELELLLRIRKLVKIRDTYLWSFIRETNTDGYMHPSFNLHTVRTYRSSGSNPNFQNIPKRDKEAMRICRKAILPRPGHMLIEADFSAIEVTVGCFYHKDPVMLDYIKDKKSDMHLDMAKQIFLFDQLDKHIPTHAVLRQAAKNSFVFPQFYGDYYGNNAKGICEWVKLPQGLWKRGIGIELPEGGYISDHFWLHKIRSFDQFVDHMKQVEDDFWNRRFKIYQQWKEAWVQQYRHKGYLRMLTGFTCSGVMRKNEITNYAIQGTAFHCLLKTFILFDEVIRKEGLDSRLIGQVHDSMVIDVNPNELDQIKDALQKIVKEELPTIWPWIIVPLEIEIDTYEVDKPWVK
jgi:DNA polymerase-1